MLRSLARTKGDVVLAKRDERSPFSPGTSTCWISSLARRFSALRPAVGIALLLGSACQDSESAANDPRASEGSPNESSNPVPAAPAGQATTNTESIANGPTPALDDTGATGSRGPAIRRATEPLIESKWSRALDRIEVVDSTLPLRLSRPAALQKMCQVTFCARARLPNE